MPEGLSNADARRWYHAALKRIPRQLDASAPLEQQALQAYRLWQTIIDAASRPGQAIDAAAGL